MTTTNTTTTPGPRKTVKTTTQQKVKGARAASISLKDLDYYANLEYAMELIPDDGGYVASHPDLPGCVSAGSTPNEAVENLGEVRILWLEGQLASGKPIPEPSKVVGYSGKFVLRIPKTLHRLADFRAHREGVSLNAYVASVLAAALGVRAQEATPPKRTVPRD